MLKWVKSTAKAEGFVGFLNHVPQSTFQLMKRAGFEVAYVGVESGSDKQRRLYHKLGSASMIGEGIIKAKRANMVVFASFITGAPGETSTDRELSKTFVKKYQPHVIGAQVLNIHPGSQLWHELIPQEEPKTLEDTRSRMIYTFPGQLDQGIQENELRKLILILTKTLLDIRRLFELI